ncbi:MAG: hypothetical protein HKN36_10865 [Hellea sp.]|nr:hypothetical protein [Hellea sp.]
MMKYLALPSLLLMLSACTTIGETSKTSSQVQNQTDRLAARELSPGECGLFVFTADDERRFILFSQASNSEASWWTETGEVKVRRTGTDGFVTYGQAPGQNFELPNGGVLKLVLGDPQEIDRGTRYKAGRITSADADGWEKIMPVIGAAGCQAGSR